MNGAMALDCEKTISSPNSTNTTTIGSSQYFFSAIRNCQNSASTRLFAMIPLIHLREVRPIAIANGMRRPAGPAAAALSQWIAPEQAPDHADRHQHQRKRQRQDDAGVDVAKQQREPPPHLARPP